MYVQGSVTALSEFTCVLCAESSTLSDSSPAHSRHGTSSPSQQSRGWTACRQTCELLTLHLVRCDNSFRLSTLMSFQGKCHILKACCLCDGICPSTSAPILYTSHWPCKASSMQHLMLRSDCLHAPAGIPGGSRSSMWASQCSSQVSNADSAGVRSFLCALII